MTDARAKTTLVHIEELTAWDKNPRLITENGAAGLQYSVERFGDVSGFTFNRAMGALVSAHQRKGSLLDIAKQRGVEPVITDPGDDGASEQWGWITIPAYEHPDLGAIPERKWPLRFVRWSEREHTMAAITANNPEIEGAFTNAMPDLLKGFAEEEAAALARLRLSIEEEVKGPSPTPKGPGRAPGSDDLALVEKWGVEPGQIWEIGRHRLAIGDSRDPAVLKRLTAGAWVELIHADPPYGFGKEAEGVANDDLKGRRLDRFQMEWARACLGAVAPDCSLYIWGEAEDLWRLWYIGDDKGRGENGEPLGLGPLQLLDFDLSVRNEIVWAKGTAGAAGIGHQGLEGLRRFPCETERALVIMRGPQSPPINAADYWEGWEPLRLYMEEQLAIVGWTPADTYRITGTRMHSHWFSRSQWVLITPEHYEALQGAAGGRAFLRPHDHLAAEGAMLKTAYQAHVATFFADRAPFDNTHELMTDVWPFPPVRGEARWGHPTPKPVDLVRRVLRSSSREGAAVLVPFAGSGSDLAACHIEGRRFLGVELLPRWGAVILERAKEELGLSPRCLETPGEDVPPTS